MAHRLFIKYFSKQRDIIWGTRNIVLLTSLFTFCLIRIRLRGEGFMSDMNLLRT